MNSIVDKWSIPDVLRLMGYQLPDRQGFIRCPNPSHEDHNPSCHVVSGESGWVCFSCNARGGILDLIVLNGFATDRADAAAWLEENSV